MLRHSFGAMAAPLWSVAAQDPHPLPLRRGECQAGAASGDGEGGASLLRESGESQSPRSSCSIGFEQYEGSQNTTSPCPMVRVPTELRRVPSAVPRTVVGACDGRQKCTIIRVFYAVFCNTRTQLVELSARMAKTRVKNAYDGTCTCWTSLARNGAFQPYLTGMYK